MGIIKERRILTRCLAQINIDLVKLKYGIVASSIKSIVVRRPLD